jgi:hypothetical protein
MANHSERLVKPGKPSSKNWYGTQIYGV